MNKEIINTFKGWVQTNANNISKLSEQIEELSKKDYTPSITTVSSPHPRQSIVVDGNTLQLESNGVAVSELDLSEIIKTGWVNISDNTYTTASPLAITDGVRTKMAISADSVIDSFAPSGTSASDFWDNTNKKFTPLASGDTYTIRLDFTANPDANNLSVNVDLDIGGSQGIIFERSARLVRGASNDTKISMTFQVFTLGTFTANGGEFYITGDGVIDVSDVAVFITRTTTVN